MRLVLQLVGRLFVIVILCLGAATVWATIDAHRSVDRATAASAERVSVALEALYWRELMLRSSRMREQLLPAPQWRTIETMGLISPGICVQIEPAGAFENPLCGQSKGIGQIPPRWFAAAVQKLLGDHAAIVRPISARAAGSRQAGAAASRDLALARDRARPPEAMEAGDEVEDGNDARNVGAVGADHQMEQSVSPQKDDGENRQPGEDHP